MDADQAEKLLRLADFLASLPPEKFNYNLVCRTDSDTPEPTPRCGTTGCAMGWMPNLWPEEVRWQKTSSLGDGNEWTIALTDTPVHYYGTSRETAMSFFGLTDGEAGYLFFPRPSYYSLYDQGANPFTMSDKPSARQVADHLRSFVAKKFPNLREAVAA